MFAVRGGGGASSSSPSSLHSVSTPQAVACGSSWGCCHGGSPPALLVVVVVVVVVVVLPSSCRLCHCHCCCPALPSPPGCCLASSFHPLSTPQAVAHEAGDGWCVISCLLPVPSLLLSTLWAEACNGGGGCCQRCYPVIIALLESKNWIKTLVS